MSANIKDKTRKVVLSLFNNYSPEKALEICKQMYFIEKPKSGSSSDWSDCKGEICEAVLEGLLSICKKDNWIISKGLILRDPDNPSFLTESDLLVITECKIFLFECKSYDGEKKLTGDCTICRKSGKRDVYSQNKMHGDILLKNIKDFYIGIGNPKSSIQLSLFLFCKGKVNDLRSNQGKGLMPCIGPNNINKFLISQNVGKKVWDLKQLKSFITKLESTNDSRVQEHLNLVKSLHK